MTELNNISVGEATTVDWPDWPIYLGQYTDYTQGDSTDPSVYTWSVMRGNDGAQGPQGIAGATGAKGDKGDTGFFVGTTPPPNPAVGTVWTTTDASGNMVSAKTWNGLSWVDTAFTQDLIAGNITATKIVGGELDVNKITIENAQNIPIESTVSLGKKLSDIKQDADGLLLTVKNGGQNLLRDTDTMPFWSGDKEKVDTFTVVKSINPNTNGAAYDPIAWNNLSCIKPNTDYTLTFYARADQNGVLIYSYLYNIGTNSVYKDGSTANTLTTSYQRYEIHFHTEDFSDGRTVNCLPMRIVTPNVACYIYGVQLEEGAIATAWSPSPSDLSALKITSDSLNAYVRGSNGSNTLKAILSMDPNNSTIGQVVNGQVVAAINTSSDGSVKIDGKTLHITADTKIENAVIKSAMIESLGADKLTAGTIDASQIKVINLDANNITTGTLSAKINDLRKFQTYVVSSSNTWNFDDTKSAYGNWFLIGEISTDHVWNGPPGITPYMYVTSRGSSDNSRFTVTVWKDNDPTQYQRVWNGNSWSSWITLPNSQNLVSTINLSPDSVKISGKNIELDGNTTIAGGFALSADKIISGTLNGMTITGSRFVANTDNGNLFGTLWKNYQVVVENTGLNIHGTTSPDNKDVEAILTSDGLYLQMVTDDNKWTKSIDINTDGPQPYIKLINSGSGYSSTYIGSDNISSKQVSTDNFLITGNNIRVLNNKYLLVTNSAGTNFDNNGSVIFQVWGGVTLGQNTIAVPSNDFYIQQGNADNILKNSYSAAGKVNVHCNSVISQKANTVSSRLSVKTDISKVTYDRALAAVEGTHMYDYRYVSDDSGQHYVSGIIDDINPEPQYHMDGMLINKERTARIDANLVGYHHVVIQKLLERVAALEEKTKS